MEFTDSQKKAVETRGRSLMVSAAAGSGKTATLTARIISLLTDVDSPADISKMLVVTFTRAAAAELRERISAALSRALAADRGNTRLASQLAKAGGAHICTIDSYYLDLIRANFYRLGLPSSVRMADEGETENMRLEVAADTAERLFATEPGFALFAETLTGIRGENDLPSWITRLDGFLSRTPEGDVYAGRCADLFEREAKADFFDPASRFGTALAGIISSKLRDAAGTASALIEDAAEDGAASRYIPALMSDMTFAREALERLASGSYTVFREFVSGYAPAKLATVRADDKTPVSEAVAKGRGKIKEMIKSCAELCGPTQEEISSQLCACAAFCRIAQKTEEAYSAALKEKKAAGMSLDFSDLSALALKLLEKEDGSPSAVALAEREKYTHIFVDEYQDTDSVQDRIFRLIGNGSNLFIVGDIKQSIYSFRGADPRVFSAYRSEFPPLAGSGNGPASIYMSENFRCSREVIEFTNMVCGFLFSAAEDGGAGAGIGYRPEDALIFKRQYPDGPPEGDGRVRIFFPDPVPGDGVKTRALSEAAECGYVVSEIKKLLTAERLPGGRHFLPGDIAVISRTGGALRRFETALTSAGIPVRNCSGEDLFATPEVLLFFSLLAAADNPSRDVQLAAALRSPLFGFSLDDLVRLKCADGKSDLWTSVQRYAAEGEDRELGEMCSRAVSVISDYRGRAEMLPLSQFVRSLWRETDAISYAGLSSSSAGMRPEERRRSLRQLYSLALSYESGGYRTLHDFVRYVDTLISRGTKINPGKDTPDGAVKLLTVHGSKGLEFPAVFIVDAASGFNRTDSKQPAVMTLRRGLGISSRISGPYGLCQSDTLMRKTASAVISELGIEEEIRILYVAMTRARERLYITSSGSTGYTESLISSGSLTGRAGGRGKVLGAKCFAEWIIAATGGAEAGDSFVAAVGGDTPPGAEAATGDGGPESRNARGTLPGLPAGSGGRTEDTGMTGEPGGVPPETAATAGITRRLIEKFAYRYPYADLAGIPAKLSVSRLFPDALTESSESEDSELLASLQAEELEPRVPRFAGGGAPDAAERGTATHLFLQFFDPERVDGSAASTDAEAERLASLGFIDAGTASLIRRDELQRFFRSRFFARMKAAVKLYREFRFNVLLPAAEFTTDPERKRRLAEEDEKILVQGVVDILLESGDGTLTLCDYKTDRLPGRAAHDAKAAAALMSERHGRQLLYYAEAVRRIFGRRPDRVCVFPLQLGEAVDIELPEK
ncbi:MAG: UvrD-helicase domain-containing protein [Clostridia bacterium]|nr:UvrD-helicase domain-containing protein [Clostridia bacterium]